MVATRQVSAVGRAGKMSRDGACPLDCKVYVGNLGSSGNKADLEKTFSYYGPIRHVWMARNPPGFAFVEFEDSRDATDAVREMDGRTLNGYRLRVELSTGERRSQFRGQPSHGGSGTWRSRLSPRYDDYRAQSPPRRRSGSRDWRRNRSLSRGRRLPSRSRSLSRSPRRK
uniref:serine/arginine-rich splicing factor 3-like isoform X2 n=1 Tax=Myxine glutinosa TaxID=7769 RepID=UPI0035901695